MALVDGLVLGAMVSGADTLVAGLFILGWVWAESALAEDLGLFRRAGNRVSFGVGCGGAGLVCRDGSGGLGHRQACGRTGRRLVVDSPGPGVVAFWVLPGGIGRLGPARVCAPRGRRRLGPFGRHGRRGGGGGCFVLRLEGAVGPERHVAGAGGGGGAGSGESVARALCSRGDVSVRGTLRVEALARGVRNRP